MRVVEVTSVSMLTIMRKAAVDTEPVAKALFRTRLISPFVILVGSPGWTLSGVPMLIRLDVMWAGPSPRPT